eukprot:2335860-Prymnesium_polylepis.1
MGAALARGMTLAFSLNVDYDNNMSRLDSQWCAATARRGPTTCLQSHRPRAAYPSCRTPPRSWTLKGPAPPRSVRRPPQAQVGALVRPSEAVG